jgi:hypothetical protein
MGFPLIVSTHASEVVVFVAVMVFIASNELQYGIASGIVALKHLSKLFKFSVLHAAAAGFAVAAGTMVARRDVITMTGFILSVVFWRRIEKLGYPMTIDIHLGDLQGC